MVVRRRKENGGRKVHVHSIGSRNRRARAMHACTRMGKISNDADAHDVHVHEVENVSVRASARCACACICVVPSAQVGHNSGPTLGKKYQKIEFGDRRGRAWGADASIGVMGEVHVRAWCAYA